MVLLEPGLVLAPEVESWAGPGVEAWVVLLDPGLVLEPEVESWAGPGVEAWVVLLEPGLALEPCTSFCVSSALSLPTIWL